MLLTLEKDAQMKVTKRVVLAGTEVEIVVNRQKPMLSLIKPLDGTMPFNIKTGHLHQLFPSTFIKFNLEEIEEWLGDGVCDSVAGEQVEIDGWDENGFPSMLLAVGMI